MMMQVFRGSRDSSKEYLMETLKNMINVDASEVLRYDRGFLNTDVIGTMLGIKAVHFAFDKYCLIPIHVFRLIFDPEDSQQTVCEKTVEICDMIYNECGYQVLAKVIRIGDTFCMDFVINSVSYLYGKVFHDNNTSLTSFILLLEHRLNRKIELDVSVMFSNGSLADAFTDYNDP